MTITLIIVWLACGVWACGYDCAYVVRCIERPELTWWMVIFVPLGPLNLLWCYAEGMNRNGWLAPWRKP